MATTYTQMVDVEYCLICKDFIGKGHDPAICNKESCKNSFEYEMNWIKFAKQQLKNRES